MQSRARRLFAKIIAAQKIYVPYTFRIKSVITGFNNEAYFAVHGLLSVDSRIV